MTAALVLGVHNALKATSWTLHRLHETVPSEIPLVLVDDASAPETAGWLDDYLSQPGEREIAFLRNERQQLFTRTFNRGMRHAYYRFQPDVIVCLNSDLDLTCGWLDWLMKGFLDPCVGIVGYPEVPDTEAWRKKAYTEQRRPEYVTGHCLGLRVRMLAEIGVFCETDTTGRDDPALAAFHGQSHIGSERILGYRANLAGWKTLYCHFPGCTHDSGGPSWGRDLGWLHHFKLDPLWAACDTLAEPVWKG